MFKRMKQDIRLIGLDLDETLLTKNKTVSPRVMETIGRAVDKGIFVLPATGRPLQGIPDEVLAIPRLQYAVTSNGARVHNIQTGEVIYSDCFSKEKALEILRLCLPMDTQVGVFAGGKGYCSPKNLDYLRLNAGPDLEKYLRISRVAVEDLESFVEKSEEPIEKISIYFKGMELRQQLKQRLEDRGDLSVTSSIEHNLELNTATANKGTALLALGEKLGFDQSQIMAMGDNSNDVAMLEAAGFGVAMGNAPDWVKERADYVTLTNEQDGVAAAIEYVMSE